MDVAPRFVLLMTNVNSKAAKRGYGGLAGSSKAAMAASPGVLLLTSFFLGRDVSK
jgi:hypothetical protein